MSFIAKLTVDGDEANVLHCRFHFSQETDATLKPTSIAQGGIVEVTIESNGKADFFDWMISPTQTKSGQITFFRRDTMSQLKTLKFIEAHCIDYVEEYTHNGEYAMQITLQLSAKEVKMNDSSFKKNWPV